MKDQREIQIDDDIDISRLYSDNLKILCCKYDSIFLGNHDNVDDIYFIDKQKRYFFTFTDGINSVYANMLHISEEERTNLKGDLAFMCPILRAVYVLKGFRGKGLQTQLLQELNSIAEETTEPYIAIADPFRIKDSRYENCIRKALYLFLKNGYERPHTWKKDVETQCVQFSKNNLQRFVLDNYELTQPFQHYIYLPESSDDGTKLTLKSIQRANNIIDN
jgi:GNAT superfamily N-acetyltransferase